MKKPIDNEAWTVTFTQAELEDEKTFVRVVLKDKESTKTQDIEQMDYVSSIHIPAHKYF